MVVLVVYSFPLYYIFAILHLVCLFHDLILFNLNYLGSLKIAELFDVTE